DPQPRQLAAVQRFDDQLFELINRYPGFLDRRGRDHHFLSAIGPMTCINLMAAGPIVTIQIAGKMQITSGKTILTAVFAAASSARWRRFVRSVSEYTRSACATLVPNLSVWMSIVTSDPRSSTPVRSARLRR